MPEPDDLYAFLAHAFGFSGSARSAIVSGPPQLDREARDVLVRLVPSAEPPVGDALDVLFGVLWELSAADWGEAQAMLRGIGRPRRERVLADLATCLAELAEKAAVESLPETTRRTLVQRRQRIADRSNLRTPAPVRVETSFGEPRQQHAEVVRFEPRSVELILAELNTLPGLGQVRTQVSSLVARLEVARARQRAGLPAATRPGLHAVLLGPPGTGKTMVARLLTELYGALGLLRSGRFVEAGRSSLVGLYTGHTAERVGETVARACGGVLFIDEAYSLTGDDFAAEALAELIRLMENHRDDLVVMFAGYRTEMDAFLAKNPGLMSRIGIRLEFDPYSEPELWAITELLALDAGYLIAEDARSAVAQAFAVQRTTVHFGNARAARSIVDDMITNHAVRVCATGDLSDEGLIMLTEADVPGHPAPDRPVPGAPGYL